MIDVENMLELWQEKPDITDVPNAPDLVLRHAAPAIEFRNVSFAYRNGVPILRDVSFTVGAGEQVAIVGASGAGKSTLARLLYRFYECSSGRILMDGTDIASVRQQSLRRVIAIVPQDTVLFNDTLSYNIQYGAFALEPQGPSADVVADAVRWAQLDAFVARQPKGLETKVGERGLRLSGGEKQRVAIARAILKRPAVLLFDEATSSLDSHTETHIQSAIAAVASGRTTITIAHRLSTIAHSHKIIVLDKGQVAEQGTHAELINKKGLYFQMWNRQQKTNELQADLSKLAAEEAAEAARQAAQSSPPAASGSVSPRALADFLGGETRHAVHAQGHGHNRRAPTGRDGGGQAHGLRDALLSPPTTSAGSAARPAAESATASIILHINDEEASQPAPSPNGLPASAAALPTQRSSSPLPPSVIASSNALAARASADRSPSPS
jgi:ABC-type methionine transport system ATPase subunit